jgi:uncharacterized lipoprotein YajG
MRRCGLAGALAILTLTGCGQSTATPEASPPATQSSWQTAVEFGMSCQSLSGAEHEKCEAAYEAKKNREASEKEVNEIKEAQREEKRLGG